MASTSPRSGPRSTPSSRPDPRAPIDDRVGQQPAKLRRLASSLDDLAEEEIARAHHGSLAREQRTEVEASLKGGWLPAIVATSSLEPGIDMGAVDLGVQVEGPPRSRADCSGWAAAIRSGRPRWQADPEVPRDLLQTAVVAERCSPPTSRQRGTLATRSTCWPSRSWRWSQCDVVAHGSRRDRPPGGAVRGPVRRRVPWRAGHAGRAVPFRRVRRAPTSRRVGPDRRHGRAREGAGRLAIISGGTIPDRGLFGVFTTDGSRVGELDEERVRVATRRGLPPGGVLMAYRGHHPRPGGRDPRSGRTRQASLLQGVRSGPAGRAGAGERAVHPRAPFEGRGTTR